MDIAKIRPVIVGSGYIASQHVCALWQVTPAQGVRHPPATVLGCSSGNGLRDGTLLMDPVVRSHPWIRGDTRSAPRRVPNRSKRSRVVVPTALRRGVPAPGAINYLILALDGPLLDTWWCSTSPEAVTCNLDEVAVAPAQRRNGIGSHLVSMAAKLMLSHGFQEMDAVALAGEDRALREQWLARLGFNPYEGLPGHFLHANLELLASGD